MTEKIRRIEVPKELADYTDKPSTIGVHENLSAQHLVDIASRYGVWHLVQSNGTHFKREVGCAEIMIEALEKFQKFPVSSILTPDQANDVNEKQLLIQSQTFNQARHKDEVLNSLLNQLQNFKLSESLKYEIVLVADEMFTNAIFNAPHVDFKKNGPGADRTAANGSLNLKPARIFFGADQERLVLGCEDAYGTLNPARLLEKLNSCYSKGASASINWEGGGAGLGTFLIFRSALSFYAGVTPGKTTVVACTFPARRLRFEPVQNLHLSSKSRGE